MKKIRIGSNNLTLPAIVVGCMRINNMEEKALNEFIHSALDQGANFFDHADIYGGGDSETLFGNVLNKDSSITREDLILQSKCGIRQGFYDLSEEYILSSVDGILKRLQTEYLDILLLHRPDALTDPAEVASAFDKLTKSGKVRHFGVSNHKPMQIELLKKYVSQPLVINQLQFSLPVSNMVANGMEVNMDTPGSFDHDDSVLDYSRLHEMTIQAWSPFQGPNWSGCFFHQNQYQKLNEAIDTLAAKYGVNNTTIATAWILRHPANMQVISGTTKADRLEDMVKACDLSLSREEWYHLYLAAGHPLP